MLYIVTSTVIRNMSLGKMTKNIIYLVLICHLAILSCQTKQPDSIKKTDLSNDTVYSIFNGTYQADNGVNFKVVARDSSLIISTNSINLYKYSDNWDDERVQKCNAKSIELIEATIQDDREEVARIFGDLPIDMNEYVEQYLSMHKDVLLAAPKPSKYEVENTFYIDEISNHGHGQNEWRWTTYCRVYWENGKNKIIRYNWQPKTYHIDEWGLDKPVPFKNKMIFKPRAPFRSRINVYDPITKTTKLLRNIDKKEKGKAIPARFVSYNIEINQTVSARFRILESGEKYLEIGALNKNLLTKAKKIK